MPGMDAFCSVCEEVHGGAPDASVLFGEPLIGTPSDDEWPEFLRPIDIRPYVRGEWLIHEHRDLRGFSD